VHKQLVFLICLLLLLAIPLHQQCCPWLILWPFGSLLFVSTLHDQIRLFFVVLIFFFWSDTKPTLFLCRVFLQWKHFTSC
jgi:hypothetical protein